MTYLANGGDGSARLRSRRFINDDEGGWQSQLAGSWDADNTTGTSLAAYGEAIAVAGLHDCSECIPSTQDYVAIHTSFHEAPSRIDELVDAVSLTDGADNWVSDIAFQVNGAVVALVGACRSPLTLPP